jgi:DNA-binding GntR family transcriptional regulator
MALAPAVQNSLAEHCYQQIKEAILRLDLAPGTPLVESRLASQLGTSKSPVREALLRLTSEDLVLTSTGRSSVVAGLTIPDIRDWYELRAILEPASLGVVAATLTGAHLEAFRRTNAEATSGLERADTGRFVQGAETLHLQLVRLNPNRALVQLVEQLLEKIRRVRVALYELDRQEHAKAGMHPGIHRHYQIIDLLEERRVDEAQAVLRRDIVEFLDRLDLPEVRRALEATQLPSREHAAVSSPGVSNEEGVT